MHRTLLYWGVVMMAVLSWTMKGYPQESGALGKVEEFCLHNGFKVILNKVQGIPVVAYQLWVKTGSVYESDREAGITHIIEHMIFKGTERHPKGEIAKKIESIGGSINAYTSFEHTVYHLEVPQNGQHEALEILLDAVLRPLFDPKELELEKEVVLEEYRRSLDRPETILAWEFLSLCFKDHPYGRPIIGYEPSIKSISRQAILDYMEKHYTSDNMFLVASGNIDPEEVKTLVKRELSPLKPRKSHFDEPTTFIEGGEKFKIINKEVNQAYMELGWLTPCVTDEDTPVLEVLETILGNGKTSRLYENLRSKKRIANTISVGNMAFRHTGLFSIFATLEPNDINDCLKEIFNQMNLISNGDLTEAEIEAAKKKIELQHFSDMQGVTGRAKTIGFFEAYFGSYSSFQHYMDRIRQVSKDDIERVSKKYLTSEKAKVAFLLPSGGDFTFKAPDELFLLKEKEQMANPVKLPNGIRLIMNERHDLPIASMVVVMPGGIRTEPEEKAGISQVVSRMLLRGSGDQTADEILRQIESFGAKIETFSGRNSLGISLTCLSKDLKTLIPVVRKILTRPAFREDELNKVKQDVINIIKAKKDKPFEVTFEAFLKNIFKDHPYQRTEYGLEETVRKITRNDLTAWYHSILNPSEIVISVVGSINKTMTYELIKKEFDEIPTKTSKTIRPIVPELTSNKIVSVPNQLHQTHLMLGFLDVPIGDVLNPSLAVINTALSRQGGRLFTILRDEKGLAYVVSSFRFNGPETGAFAIYMACDPQKVDMAKGGIMEILKDISENGLTQKEIEESRSYILGSMLIEEQYSAQVALKTALDEMLGLGFNYMEIFKEKIKQVTAEDIKVAAKKIFDSPYVFVSVGPK